MAVAERAPGRSGALWTWLMLPWQELGRSGLAELLVPQPAVRVVHPAGAESVWRGVERQVASPRSLRGARYVALALPESERLEYTVRLPDVSGDDLEQALALDVQAASPFEPDDLAWGHRRIGSEGSQVSHRVVLASRRRIQALMESVDIGASQPGDVEVWAIGDAGAPLVLAGYGERRRTARSAWGVRASVALVALGLLLAVAIALTPTVRLELEARQARAALAELETRLAPVLVQRESLLRILERQEALRVQMEERVEPLAVIDRLTQAVGDESWVQRLQVQGAKVSLAGQSPNAAVLMNRLSGHPMVRDVRATVPATRAASGRENFQIEFNLVGTALRPASAAGAAPAAATLPAAPAGSAPAAAAALTASAPGR